MMIKPFPKCYIKRTIMKLQLCRTSTLIYNQIHVHVYPPHLQLPIRCPIHLYIQCMVPLFIFKCHFLIGVGGGGERQYVRRLIIMHYVCISNPKLCSKLHKVPTIKYLQATSVNVFQVLYKLVLFFF